MEFKQPSKTKLSGSATFLKLRLFALCRTKTEKTSGWIHENLLKKEISYDTILPILNILKE